MAVTVRLKRLWEDPPSFLLPDDNKKTQSIRDFNSPTKDSAYQVQCHSHIQHTLAPLLNYITFLYMLLYTTPGPLKLDRLYF